MKEWQKDRIDKIKKILPKLGENYVLKGGTALLLYYGLDRFSEDVDLDSISGNMNILNKLKTIGQNKWNMIIKKDTETVFRVMVDYGATNNYGDYPLKIEISSRNKKFLQSKIYDYKNIAGVNVYSLEEILKMKIRDFYDLSYFLKKQPEKFTKDMLIDFKERMDYKNLDTLSYLLKEEFEKNELKDISKNSEEIVLETYDKIENLVINYSKNKNLELNSEKNKEMER
mgnify:CR=1 FL=1